MSANTLSGPDLVQGVSLSQLGDNGMLLGHAYGEPVILVRHDDQLFAVGALTGNKPAIRSREQVVPACGRR